MCVALRICALLLAIATAAGTADSDADQIFNKARAKVLDNTRRMPRYTCVETVARSQYLPSDDPTDCASLITMQRLIPTHGRLLEHDRLRLDVAVVETGEIFSWAGAGKFETTDLSNLIGGASASGEFGSFLASVFGGAPDAIRFTGLSNNFARFEYNVPFAKSTYRFHTKGHEKTVAYRGEFSVDPADGDLHQLIVETEQFTPADGVCRVQHKMDYTKVKIGSGQFLLPEVSTMDALYTNGTETLNETRYSDCREYVGESTIRFDDVDAAAAGTAASKAALQPLPPKVRFLIGLSKPIQTETAAAGDAVEGVVLRDVTDKKLGTLAKVNDRVHGRILRLQQSMGPPARWYMAIRFDTIERNGRQQPIALKPVDDGDRSTPSFLPSSSRIRGAPLSRQAMQRPENAGVFVFTSRGNIVLDQNFHSEWETR